MAKSFQDIMAEARKGVPEIAPQQVNDLLTNNGKSHVLLDVRESDEWRQGHLEGALPLPRGFLEIKVETAIPDKNAPIIAYCAGVGTLGIIDNDVVDISNLQRQILHSNDRVGTPKVESAKKTLEALNPDVKVIPYNAKLTSENIMDIIKDYDLVVDGCDNFPTRYLVNDACVLAGKPNVHGSIFQFEGQATVFYRGKGPCYRCLYPEPPPAEMAPSCAEAGVLGVLPGLIGVIEALEAIKIILDKGETLVGRLVHFNTLTMEINTLKLRRDPNCPMCGDHPTIHELIDYEEFCGLRH